MVPVNKGKKECQDKLRWFTFHRKSALCSNKSLSLSQELRIISKNTRQHILCFLCVTEDKQSIQIQHEQFFQYVL